MLLERIDASDDAQFRAWFDVFSRSENTREGRSGQGWHPDEWRARAVDLEASRLWHLMTFGDDASAPVAVAAAEVGRDDNLHWLRAELHVDPDRRRRGHGSAALVQLEQYARDLERPCLVVGVIEGSGEVGRAPNRYFAPLHGYTIADEAVRRDVEWPRPPGELDRLEEQWRPHADGYEIVQWVGATPERWVADRVHLSAVMPAEAPYADLDVEVEKWDVARLRSHEHTVNEMGRDLFVAAAHHVASGSLAGYSELTLSREFFETAYQWDTLVLGRHRGHRLGGLLKIANMRALAESGYGVKRISTFNSSLNAPMIRVNDDLGAEVAGAQIMWRKDL